MSSRPVVEVRRSARRRRTVAAFREGDKIIIMMPARTSRSEEQRLVAEMIERIQRREERLERRGPRASDGALMSRATQLSSQHLEGRAKPATVTWVTNMGQRWGSCTPTDATIRISHRLRTMPDWVLDYVLVHELSHLLVAGHSPEFWAWVDRYPRTERAKGFLEGVALSSQWPVEGEPELEPSVSSLPGGSLAGPAGLSAEPELAAAPPASTSPDESRLF
ncbi:MAG: putative metal-dependent hydrolase [Frankiales bacterium]|nr:putative metal-dependent hydrolase [Frankiales bacterium]